MVKFAISSLIIILDLHVPFKVLHQYAGPVNVMTGPKEMSRDN